MCICLEGAFDIGQVFFGLSQVVVCLVDGCSQGDVGVGNLLELLFEGCLHCSSDCCCAFFELGLDLCRDGVLVVCVGFRDEVLDLLRGGTACVCGGLARCLLLQSRPCLSLAHGWDGLLQRGSWALWFGSRLRVLVPSRLDFCRFD